LYKEEKSLLYRDRGLLYSKLNKWSYAANDWRKSGETQLLEQHRAKIEKQEAIDKEKFAADQKAAASGNVEALYNLGIAYKDGIGVKENFNEAIKWYRKAAKKGHAEANEWLNKNESKIHSRYDKIFAPISAVVFAVIFGILPGFGIARLIVGAIVGVVIGIAILGNTFGIIPKICAVIGAILSGVICAYSDTNDVFNLLLATAVSLIVGACIGFAIEGTIKFFTLPRSSGKKGNKGVSIAFGVIFSLFFGNISQWITKGFYPIEESYIHLGVWSASMVLYFILVYWAMRSRRIIMLLILAAISVGGFFIGTKKPAFPLSPISVESTVRIH